MRTTAMADTAEGGAAVVRLENIVKRFGGA